MRPINLIPEQERRRDGIAAKPSMMGWAVIALLALVVVGAAAYAVTANSLSSSERELAELQHRDAELQQRAAQLAPYLTFNQTTQARKQTVAELAASRFDWERVMRELALIVPSDVVVRTLTATVAPSVNVPGATKVDLRSAIPGPALELTGCGMGGQDESQEAVARFISALYDIDGVTRVGMKEARVGADTDRGEAGALGSCDSRREVSNFQIAVAFDQAEAAISGEAVPPPVTAPPPSDSINAGSGDPAAPDRSVQDSAADATQQANAAAETYIPGG